MDRDSMTFRRTDDDKKNGTTDLKMWNGEFELESGKLWMTGGEGARAWNTQRVVDERRSLATGKD